MNDDIHPANDPWIGEKFRSTDSRDLFPRIIFVHSLATADGYPKPGYYVCEFLTGPEYKPTHAGRPFPLSPKVFKASTLKKHWKKTSH